MGGFQPIGEMLVSYGKLTTEQLSSALVEKRNGRKRLGEVLVDMRFVSEQDIAECLSAQFGYDIVLPENLVSEPGALAMFDGCFALEQGVLPLRNGADALECAISDPLDVVVTDTIVREARKRVVFRIATRSALSEAIKQSYHLVPPSCYLTKPVATRRKSIKPQVDRAALLAMFDAEVGIATEPRPVPAPRKRRRSTPGKAGDQL